RWRRGCRRRLPPRPAARPPRAPPDPPRARGRRARSREGRARRCADPSGSASRRGPRGPGRSRGRCPPWRRSEGLSNRRSPPSREPIRMKIIALFGPTGVGKTAVAIAIAERLRERGEDPVAVSADALQVYAGLETLTGAATLAEQARLEHRLLSFLPVDATFSVGEYSRLAHAQIDDLLAQG